MKALFLLFLFSTLSMAQDNDQTIINGVAMSSQDLSLLQQQLGVEIKPGEYWYDKKSGIWGLKCQGAAGGIAAGLHIGGELAQDASCGTSRMFFNGRELHQQELQYLIQLFGVAYPGHYHIDPAGNLFTEEHVFVVNLWGSIQRSQRILGGYYSKYGNKGFFSGGCSSFSSNSAGGGYNSVIIGCE